MGYAVGERETRSSTLVVSARAVARLPGEAVYVHGWRESRSFGERWRVGAAVRRAPPALPTPTRGNNRHTERTSIAVP